MVGGEPLEQRVDVGHGAGPFGGVRRPDHDDRTVTGYVVQRLDQPVEARLDVGLRLVEVVEPALHDDQVGRRPDCRGRPVREVDPGTAARADREAGAGEAVHADLPRQAGRPALGRQHAQPDGVRVADDDDVLPRPGHECPPLVGCGGEAYALLTRTGPVGHDGQGEHGDRRDHQTHDDGFPGSHTENRRSAPRPLSGECENRW